MTTTDTIKKLAKSGMKTKAIMEQLAKQGIKTKSGNAISSAYIYTVLSKKKSSKSKKNSTKKSFVKTSSNNYFTMVTNLPISDAMKVQVLSAIYGS